MLDPARQSELEDLTASLATWGPDKIATEAGFEDQPALDDDYQLYRRGEPPETLTERHEIVQIGFRLADRLDSRSTRRRRPAVRLVRRERPVEALEEDGDEPAEKAPISLSDFDTRLSDLQEKLASSSIPEFLASLSEEPQRRLNHYGMFTRGIRWGRGDNYGGS